jgi:hypothetical protein
MQLSPHTAQAIEFSVKLLAIKCRKVYEMLIKDQYMLAFIKHLLIKDEHKQ